MEANRRKLWIGLGAAVVVIVVAVWLIGGSGSSDDKASGSAASSASGAPLVVNSTVAPSTLDPIRATDLVGDGTLVENLYVRLTQYGTKPGPDGTLVSDQSKVEGYLADSWDVSKDGREYTFTLKPGLTFASGTPVDASAVKFSFDRALKGAGSYFVSNGLPGNIVKVAAPNATTVVITLKTPDPGAPAAYATMGASIVDPTLAKQGDTALDAADGGSGPFELTSYQPNNRAVLTARSAYWKWAGKTPPAKRITLSFVNSDSSALLQAQSAEADVTMGLSPQSVASLDGNDAVRIIGNPSTITQQVVMAWDRPPFDKREVREAAALAVPYEQILDKVASGFGELFYGPLSPGMPYFNAELSKPLEYDIAKARSVLNAAGIDNPGKVTLTIAEGNRLQEQVAAILQDSWGQIGLDVSVRKLAAAQYAEALFGHKVQAALREDGPAISDPGFFLGYDMRCEVAGIGTNLANICIPAADKLLDQARQSDSDEERQALYDKLTELWRPEFPKIFLFNVEATTVLGKAMKTFTYASVPDMRTWGK